MNTGDVVQLKSGGPLMTVELYDWRGVYCVFYDGGRLVRDTFTSEMLVTVPDPGSVAVVSE